MRGRGAGTPNVTAVQHADAGASVAIGCHSQAIIRLVGARRLRPYMRVTALSSATLLTRPHTKQVEPADKAAPTECTCRERWASRPRHRRPGFAGKK